MNYSCAKLCKEVQHPVTEGEKLLRLENLGDIRGTTRTPVWLQHRGPRRRARSWGPKAMSQVGMQAWGQWEATDEFLCLKIRDQCFRKPTLLVQRLFWIKVAMPYSGIRTVEGIT